MGGALRVVGRLDRVEVRGERHLRVDDHDLPAGKAHDQVGAEPAVVRGRRHLLVEVAVGQHPRQLDDSLELDLAPATADMRCAERRRERGGALAQLRELLAERAVRSFPCELERPYLAVDLLQRLLERTDVARQLRLGDLQERRAVRPIRVGRGGPDRRHDLLVEGAALDVELGMCAGKLALDDTEAARRVQPDGDGAEEETEEESENDHRADER